MSTSHYPDKPVKVRRRKDGHVQIRVPGARWTAVVHREGTIFVRPDENEGQRWADAWELLVDADASIVIRGLRKERIEVVPWDGQPAFVVLEEDEQVEEEPSTLQDPDQPDQIRTALLEAAPRLRGDEIPTSASAPAVAGAPFTSAPGAADSEQKTSSCAPLPTSPVTPSLRSGATDGQEVDAVDG